MQVKDSILYFLLLVLKILLDLSLDVSYKQGRFSKALSEKSFKLVLSKRNGIIVFNLSFVLLPAEVDPISEKQGCKRDAFVAYGSGRVKIIFTLSNEVIALHMQAFIVKVRVPGLEGAIVGCGTCLKLAIFLAFNKQF